MTDTFKKDQLRQLIERYPADKYIDIYGVILDFIGETDLGLEDIFEINHRIYTALFASGLTKDAEKTLILLSSIIAKSGEKSRLLQACKGKYSEVNKLLKKLSDKTPKDYKKNAAGPNKSFPPGISNLKISGIIWQLSDIHFGGLNYLKLNPTELASALVRFVTEVPTCQPKMILISGDVTSAAKEDEFNQFNKFCEELSTGIWGGNFQHRILVVPGNHDTSWLSDGKADKLQSFRNFVHARTKMITPWTKDTEIADDHGRIIVKNFDFSGEDLPPFCIVKHEGLKLNVLLLVSSYYSGFVPAKVIELIETSADMATLMSLLRIDEGEIKHPYITKLAKYLVPDDFTTIALMHHNLNQVGIETCRMEYARALLELLKQKNVNLLFHGHTHILEAYNHSRSIANGEAFSIPCPTLSSLALGGTNNAFFVHVLGSLGNTPSIATVVCPFSEYKFIEKERIYTRYLFKLRPGKLGKKDFNL